MKYCVVVACMMLLVMLAACERAPAPAPKKPTALNKQVVSQSNDLDWVRNIEMVPFCLPIPKAEYVLDEKSELPRGSRAYVHKTRGEDFIQVRGMMRSDPSVSIADYYRNSYAKAEESGQIIEEKKLLDAQGVFYAKFSMNNLMYKQRFIEVTWLRKDEVVTYTAGFAINEAPAWQKHLHILLEHNSRCE